MSLTASLRAVLRKFENLIENKHMNTNHTQQASTPDADICGELRTKSGQDETGITVADQAHAIRKLFRKVFGAVPIYMGVNATPPAPAAVEVKAPSKERCLQLADMENGQTVGAVAPPAERPTPITLEFTQTVKGTPLEKFWSAVGRMESLERQLAELRNDRDGWKREAESWRETAGQRRRQFENCRGQRDRLAEACSITLKRGDAVQTSDQYMREVLDANRDALAAVTGGAE